MSANEARRGLLIYMERIGVAHASPVGTRALQLLLPLPPRAYRLPVLARSLVIIRHQAPVVLRGDAVLTKRGRKRLASTGANTGAACAHTLPTV